MSSTKFNGVLILTFLLFPLFVNAFVTVGLDPNSCTYDNLFDAYEDPDVNVRVTSEQTHSLLFAISKSKFFKGGYDNCDQANLDNVGVTKSKWSGINSGVVLFINANLASQSLISFSNFEIYDGNDIAGGAVGGVIIFGKSTVSFVNSDIHHNTGNDGGGIQVIGENAQLILNNSQVRFNISTNKGAGIFCSNSATVTIFGNSAINSNQATNEGGGIYSDGCTINDSSGDVNSGLDAQYGIFANTAKFGGGVYLSNGTVMNLTGNDEHPASIDFNFSTNSNEQFAGGGGIYMKDIGTILNATNAKIINNYANTSGAGFVVLDSAQLYMERQNTPCWDNDKCSEISNNIVQFIGGHAGAGYIRGNSTVNIAQTFINNNKARASAIFDVRQSHVILEGNLITNHKANTAPITSDSLISLADSSHLDFYYNTLSGNNAFHIFELKLKTSQELNIFNSLIWDSGDIYSEIDNSGATLPLAQNAQFYCNYIHELDSMTNDVSITFTTTNNPQFVDPKNGNYHLLEESQAQDLCNEFFIQSNHKDLNGHDRGIDLDSIFNLLGPFDAGAYESMNPTDDIFNNSFE
jgi:hypothetical protein